MNRVEYINRLKIALQGMPNEELKDILSDYEEHFDIGISKGKTEEEISRELGNPREVASSYRTTYRPNMNKSNFYENSSYGDDSTRKVLITILLIAFNVIIVLGPFIGLLGLLLGIYGIGISFIIGGLVAFLGFPLTFLTPIPTPHIVTSISFGIGLIALGLLTLILAVYLSKGIYKLTLKYINWNIDLINRGGAI